MLFKENVKQSYRKPNKIWVDQGSEFCNSSLKSWLEKHAIEMYTTLNEGKFVVAERFVRTLWNAIYKFLTSISKNICIDKLGDVLNKYNNTYNNTVKMKLVDVKSNTYIDSSKEVSDKDRKFKIREILLKYQNICKKLCSKLI